MDGIDGRAEERNEFPACIFIINTPVWAIVGMERERRGSSKIDTTMLLLWLEKFDISSRGTVLTWTKCEKVFLLPIIPREHRRARRMARPINYDAFHRVRCSTVISRPPNVSSPGGIIFADSRPKISNTGLSMHNEQRAPDIRIVLYIYLRRRNNAPLHSLANLPPDAITRAITGNATVFTRRITIPRFDNRRRGYSIFEFLPFSFSLRILLVFVLRSRDLSFLRVKFER